MSDADQPPSPFTKGVQDERARVLRILDEAWKSPKLKPLTRMALAVVAARVRDPEYRVASWTTFESLALALDPVAQLLTEAAHKALDEYIAWCGREHPSGREAAAVAGEICRDILAAQIAALTAGTPTADEGQS